jgi:hypothetical protein
MIAAGARAKRKTSRRLGATKDAHNHSIQDLQRQVMENQLILHNLATHGGQSVAMLRPAAALNVEPTRGKARKYHHNHNNSISQMNNLGGLPTAQQLQFAQTEHMSGAETLTKHMQAQRIGSHATTQQNFNT